MADVIDLDGEAARRAAKKLNGWISRAMSGARQPDLRVVEQSSAGRHFPDVEALPVEQDGNRVLIRGRLFKTFMTESNATRVAAALQVLADLDCPLPEPQPTPPKTAA